MDCFCSLLIEGCSNPPCNKLTSRQVNEVPSQSNCQEQQAERGPVLGKPFSEFSQSVTAHGQRLNYSKPEFQRYSFID